MTANRKRRMTPTCTLLRNGWINSRYFSRDDHAWCHLYWFRWAAKRRVSHCVPGCSCTERPRGSPREIGVLWTRSRLMRSQDILNVPCNSVFPRVDVHLESIIRNRSVRASCFSFEFFDLFETETHMLHWVHWVKELLFLSKIIIINQIIIFRRLSRLKINN